MGSLATRRVSGWRTALKLGRVSNLPTVWSNVIAACALAGGSSVNTMLTVAVAISLMYVGGMFLNDAFDADIDARERPERPIPAGEVAQSTVFLIGAIFLAAGMLILAAMGDGVALSGLALGAAIVLYDWHHKRNPLAPFVMGACRALVYVTAAVAAAATASPIVWLAAATLLAYVAGLTYVARMESLDRIGALWPLVLLAAPLAVAVPNLAPSPAALVSLAAYAAVAVALVLLLRRRAPGDVSRAIGLLIAGIAINDALFAATTGDEYAAFACLACFVLALVLQRYVPAS
jgi:4-hydroxybenzoate polyprenyltransferase